MPATPKQTPCETQPGILSSAALPAGGNAEAGSPKASSNEVAGTMSRQKLAIFSDTDSVEDRTLFVVEYNRLAKQVMTLSAFDHPSTTVPSRVV